MTEPLNVKQVGAPDPELKNSPIVMENDAEREYIRQEVPGEPECFFNNNSYPNDSYVCSSNQLLHCDYGIWLQTGSCDPDNL